MSKIISDEYWAEKGDVKLYMYRKRASQQAGLPVLFLVHGSSFSARTSFDLTVPGHEGYSMMDALAERGFDVWTMDHEGYGRSSHTDGFSYIADGVDDLKAAVDIVARETGQQEFAIYGSSSGALRAAAFAAACPERVNRLVLAALVWTGEGSPTLAKRREKIDEWQGSNRRTVDEAFYQGVFTRDVTGLTIPELAGAAAAAEMENGGGSVPNGTYIDMCINLPVVDPKKINCPVMIFRGDHDGIATDEDVLGFFRALPNQDKQLIMMSGQAHNTYAGLNRRRFMHAFNGFLTLPARVDQMEKAG
jgi:alpha-beta hydrolase superfamily lysophospholipase